MIYDLKNNYKVQCVKEYLQELIEKKAWIELKEKKPKRSLDSNALMWIWLTCIEKETGRDRNETHFLYRCLFLQREETDITTYLKPEVWGTIKKYIQDFKYFLELYICVDIISRSTTDLDDREFSEYLSKIRKHARVNFGVILLTKDDENFKDFYSHYGFL